MRRRTFAFLMLMPGLIAGVMLAGLIWLRAKAPQANDLPVDAYLGAVHVRYAPSLARLPEARTGGRLDHLDLEVTFPDFAAAAPQRSGDTAPVVVFLRLMPQEASIDPAERAVRLYASFLDASVWTQGSGLVMRHFVAGSPYQTDDLYLVPPEGRLFTARCLRPTQPPGLLPDTCLSDLRLQGLDVQIRFDPALLPTWERLTAGVRRLVEGLVR